MHAQSHDNDYVDRKPLHHAMYFMRRGLGLVYSDGNNHAATLSGSGGAFPRWACTDFLGQWGQKQIPTLLHAHENFARNEQIGKWSQGNFVAFQRGGGYDPDGGKHWETMIFQLNSLWDEWDYAHTAGDFPSDAYLYDYASDYDPYMPHNDNDTGWPACPYAWAGEIASTVKLPGNSYAIWSWKNPDPSGLYPSPYPECFVNTDDRIISPDSRVITIFEDGKVVDPVMVTRKDGVDGDPNFNPYNVADTNNTDYAYTIAIPRVTKGTDVTLAVKADGSAEKLMLRLDGGMDFGNGIEGTRVDGDRAGWKDWRDNPPGGAHDFELGFEDTSKWFTRRIWSEKFAAVDTAHCCKIGTQGATTYEIASSATNVYQPESQYDGPSINAPGFVYHNPEAITDPVPVEGGASVSSIGLRGKGKASAKSAAPADDGASVCASATWIGATYIFANGWYKGDGQSHDNWNPDAFNGANLGTVSGAISFGGQCQTCGESDGKGNPARVCYNILSGSGIVLNGQVPLYWYDYKDNNNWFESRTGNEGEWHPTDIDISGLDDGDYSLSVWFEADGADGTKYDNNGGANYVATFTVGEGGGGDDPDPPSPADTRATWIGVSYIHANGTWYKGDGEAASDWEGTPASFQGANLGTVSGTLHLGGQCETYEESDGKNHLAAISYNILSGNSIVANGTNTLHWLRWTGSNNRYQSLTANEGAFRDFPIDVSGLDDGTYSLAVWFWAEGATEPKYDNNNGANYVATFTVGEGGGGGDETWQSVPQFTRNGTGATIWAQTSKEQGARAFLYYTVDGVHWPEGGGGVPANTATRAVEGNWKCNVENDTKSWWRFDIPEGSIPSGATLRYKVSAFREMGYDGNIWDTIWPGDGNAVWIKKAMMSLWTIPGLDFEHQQYHKHLDYNSWTTGFEDGFHLITARVFLREDGRKDWGSPIANTFRQTFYLDRHVPEGRILYPEKDNDDVGGNSYGCVVQTDDTVTKVYYHVMDSSTVNDGPGNGFNTNGVVEWAEATLAGAWSKEMATNTALPKVWKFNYTPAPESSEQAVIRVRLCEVSSTPTNGWSQADPTADDPDELHVKEIERKVWTHGPNYYVRFDWPVLTNDMVECGWELQLKYNWEFAAGLGDDDAKALFTFQFESPGEEDGKKIVVTNFVAGSDASVSHQWNHPHENGLKIALPNLFTGKEDDLHKVIVTGKREIEGILVEITTTTTFRTKGPLLPTCIVTTPPETDSDGVKWVITMEDSVAARTNRTLRETPIVVLTDAEATKLDITFVAPTGYDASISATPGSTPSNEILRLENIADTGTSKTWTFAWQVTNAGSYRFQAVVTADNSSGKYSVATNSVVRSATVQFRQIVHGGAGDLDWDDDGIVNTNETTVTALPERTDETWTQDEVFAWWRTGKSDPDCPDTDGDGLPDGLELGCRVAGEGTDAAMDTNGDGWPNFIGDIDPPFFNVLPNKDRFQTGVIDQAGTGADRTKRVVGSVTDPRATDSDYDGLPDGLEDANRNGWTDGDGNPFPTNYDPYPEHNWADGKMVGEVWEETSPCIADSDADGLSDGYGEDKNANGWTDMGLVYQDATNTVVPFTAEDYRRYGVDNASSANSSSTLTPKPYTSRAINYEALFAAFNVTNAAGPDGTMQTNGWPRLVITETDPLCTDTDHDGLPDGWENNYSLDPLNNGVYDFRTGRFTDDPTHGPRGNPDGDTYIQGGEVVPYDNLAENLGGTNPRSSDNSSGGGGGGDPSGSITIGEGDVIGEVNGNKFFTEYTQWTLADLIALDDYNQGGNSSDIYRCWDGFDSSRDMVAFYFRDGGDRASGGDGKLYFRVDFDDLQAFAEDGHLNIYIAMNYGSYGQEGEGIRWLPDDVNCETEMRWHAVVGVYDSQNGCVYVQDGKGSQDFLRCNDAFLGAYFNSQLDSVAWSIDRDTLRDKGVTWNGLSDNLLFQVYTTRDYTSDDGGSGDKGGLNDFTDTIGDDWLCSDYGNDWNYIHQYGKYSTCVTKANPNTGWNNRGFHAKLAIVAHGNQAVEMARDMHDLVDNGQGAGYQRPVKIHNIYTNCPMNLHITPTLAMAMEWAEVGNEKTWYSGAAFNEAIRAGVAKGAFSLLGSTFSDHMIKYYPDAFNAANAKMAEDTLNAIYGNGEKVVSTNIFWLSERVADWDILQKLARMGYQATVVDQTPHLLDWFGRETALGSDAYKIQRYWAYGTDSTQGEEIKAFVLSSAADQFRFANTDSGFPVDLRHLFLRRARSSDKDVAISSLFYRWEDFTGTENSDNYDRNIRWIANHPWIQVVTLDKALEDEKLSNNLVWKDVCATNGMGMQDWVHHACNEDYDNWYYGSSRHESLADKKFQIRDGNDKTPLPYGDATNGIVKAAWDAVAGIANADVKRLAEATIFASAFETAFHIEDYNNLARWSFGEYMEPAKGWHWNDAAQDWEPMGLMAMAWKAQSRTRLAAVFSEVDAWAAANDGLKAYKKDVDLDGEDEWILRNNKVMALFEAEGGLMTGAWFKDGSNVWQMVGNFTAQPGSGYETQSAEIGMHRGAGMKDITVGGTSTVADVFNVSADTGKLTFALTGRGLTKTVSLSNASTNAFSISYSASGKQMYVRNGLSPDLATLMTTGQRNLKETADGSSVELSTVRGGRSVTATLAVTQGSVNAAATDKEADWNTVNMRNSAQVRTVEVMGTGSLAYTLAFSTEETSYEPPVISITPDDNPQTFIVGATNAFRVTVFDPDSAIVDLTVAPDPLALGGYHEASFDAASGSFSWYVAGLSSGSRTTNYETSVTFTATDGVNTTNLTVGIVVPWDSDGDDLPDDWEHRMFGTLAFGKDGDEDMDTFSNYSEYVAGTSPCNRFDVPGIAHIYTGWESLFIDEETGRATLTFRSTPGCSYVIQRTDGASLVSNRWFYAGDVENATGEYTQWVDEDPYFDNRMYRIMVLP